MEFACFPGIDLVLRRNFGLEHGIDSSTERNPLRMWCRHCLREVSAVTGGSAPAVCPLCGRGVEAVTRQSQAVREAREILERWQASDLFDRITSSDVIPEQRGSSRAASVALPKPESARSEASQSESMKSEISRSTSGVVAGESGVEELCGEPVAGVAAESTVVRGLPAPAVRRVIRELPPLPLDLLSPAPVMAGAGSTRSSGVVVVEEPPAKAVVGDDWDPPQRVDELVEGWGAGSSAGVSAAVAVGAAPLVSGAAVSEVSRQAADAGPAAGGLEGIESEAEIAAFFETTAVEFFSAEAEQPRGRLTEKTAVSEGVPGGELRTDVEAAVDTVRPAAGLFQSAVEATPEPAVGEVVSESVGEEISEAVLPASTESSVERVVEPSVALATLAAGGVAAVVESVEGPVILPTPPRRGRPALQRPAMVRRVSAVSEPVPSYSGTIPMNRNTDTRVSGVESSVPELPGPVVVSNSPESGVRERRDIGEGVTGDRLRGSGWVVSGQRYVDESHGTGLRGPHFEVSPAPRSNMTTIIGQSLAYIGVISLLVGTSMVILGHFGGETEYTPTGWLVTTVAQMLLFLGIINLVSGGMEQHNDEVARRIHSLSEHLVRIEQATAEALRASRVAESAGRSEAAESCVGSDRKQA